jgi:hypothetical protein
MTSIGRETDLTATERPTHDAAFFWREPALHPAELGGAGERRRLVRYTATWATAGLIVAVGCALSLNPYEIAAAWLAVGALGATRGRLGRTRRKQERPGP